MAELDPAASVPEQAAPASGVSAPEQAAWSPLTLGDQTFNSREDLEKAWKDSYQRQDDYTRKSQANAQMRQALQKRQAEFDQRVKEHDTKVKDYEKYDNLLSQRPDVYKQLQTMLGRPANAEVAYQRAESLVNDKTSEIEAKLEEFEQWKRQQEVEHEKAEVYKRLTEEFADFDSNDIETRFTALAEGDLEALARTLYHARVGEQSPLKVEQDITDKLKKKGGVKTASPKGAPVSAPDKIGNNIEEARNQALRDTQGE